VLVYLEAQRIPLVKTNRYELGYGQRLVHQGSQHKMITANAPSLLTKVCRTSSQKAKDAKKFRIKWG